MFKNLNFKFFLRILIIFLIILSLFNIFITRKKITYKKPNLCLLIDNSLSMNIKDKDKKRIIEAKIITNELIKKLKDKTNLEVFSFSDKIKKINKLEELKPQGNATLIPTAIKSIFDRYKLKELNSLILITDGITTEDVNYQKFLKYIKSKNIPIYSIGVGTEEGIPDLILQGLSYPNVTEVNKEIEFKIYIRNIGFKDKKIKIKFISNQGRKTQEILINNNFIISTIKFKPNRIGILKGKIEIIKDENELLTYNNLKKFKVEIKKAKYKILFLQGAPSYEFAFLKRTLSRYKKFDADFFIYKSNNEFYYNKKFNLSSLTNYDLLILSNLNYQKLKNLKINKFINLLNFKILILGGNNSLGEGGYSKDLEFYELLPVYLKNNDYREGIFKVDIFQVYRDIFEINSELPNIETVNEIEKVKDDAEVLAYAYDIKGEKYPIIIGNNKIYIVATDTTWRWCLKEEGKKEEYQKFWINLINYLLKEEKEICELLTDKEIYEKGEVVNISCFVKPYNNFKLELLKKNKKIKDIPLFRDKNIDYLYGGEIKIEDTGKYCLRLIFNKRYLTEDIEVEESIKEFEETKLNKDFLVSISKASGGKYIGVKDDINKIIKLEKVKEVKYLKFLLFDNIYFYLLIILFLTIDWYIRRR